MAFNITDITTKRQDPDKFAFLNYAWILVQQPAEATSNSSAFIDLRAAQK
jgi:hypothetical protein